MNDALAYTALGEILVGRLTDNAERFFVGRPLTPTSVRDVQSEVDRITRSLLAENEIHAPDGVLAAQVIYNRSTGAMTIVLHPLVIAVVTEAVW